MLIAVDKPKGITSFDVIKRLKHVFVGEKIGHSGTLDPLATGMMILGIGKGTKRLTELIGLDKTYIADIDFSKKSDTRDMGWWKYYEENCSCERRKKVGKNIISEKDWIASVISPRHDEIEKALQSLIPSYELPIPAFSAKQKNGKRLYELARKGEIIEEKKLMKVDKFEILGYDFPRLRIKLDVGSGTYIRSIAHWLGEEFGLGGILTDLRRVRVGCWDFERGEILDKRSMGEIHVVDYTLRGQSGSFPRIKLED